MAEHPEIKAEGTMSAVPSVTMKITRGGGEMPGQFPVGTTVREAFKVGGQTATLTIAYANGVVIVESPVVPIRDQDGVVIADAAYLLALAPEAVQVPHEPSQEGPDKEAGGGGGQPSSSEGTEAGAGR